MAERFQIRTLQNNIVKEIYKILEEEKEWKAECYAELLECGIENLRAFALEHLMRNEELFGEIMELSKGLEEEEREMLEEAIEKAREQMEARADVDLEDKEMGVKTKRLWHRRPWYKIYFV